MGKDIVLICIIGLLFIIMLFFNKKVCLAKLLVEQIKVFRNAKNNKISILDIFNFIVFPIIISIIIVYNYDIKLGEKTAEMLTTIFSIIFTVLFGFSAILVCKVTSENKLEKMVVEETFTSILTSTILSFLTIFLIVIVGIINNYLLVKIFNTFIISFSLMIFMLILMITKRILVLFINNKTK